MHKHRFINSCIVGIYTYEHGQTPEKTPDLVAGLWKTQWRSHPFDYVENAYELYAITVL